MQKRFVNIAKGHSVLNVFLGIMVSVVYILYHLRTGISQITGELTMIEHWRAMLAGVLFCLPACVLIVVMAWKDRRHKRR